MPFKQSERVSIMKENFMKLHNEGYTILEIADKYNIARRTIYSHLNEIAKENGVDRTSLLEIPHKKHERGINTGNKSYIINAQEVSFLCNDVKERVSNLLNNVEKTLKGE